MRGGRMGTLRSLVLLGALAGLLNAGPFEMIGSALDATDAYGRDLRVLKRGGRWIGDQLVEEGLVRRYGGFKMGWC